MPFPCASIPGIILFFFLPVILIAFRLFVHLSFALLPEIGYTFFIQSVNGLQLDNIRRRDTLMWGISFTPPWDGKPYAVVCYARSDRKKAASVISQLRRGTALRMQICADPSAAEEAQLFVEHCSAFICLVSRRFMSDSFCSNLLLFAARAGIKVIPVKLDSVKMPWESGNGLALSGEPRNTYSVKDRNLMKSMFSGNEELFKCLDMSSPSHSLAYLYTDSRPEPAKSVPRPSGPEPVARARTAGRSPAPKRSSGGGLAEKLKDLWKNRNPAKKL